MDSVDYSLFLDVPHFGDLLNDSKFSPQEDDNLFFSPRFDESEFDEAVKNCFDTGDSLQNYFDEWEKNNELEKNDESEKKDESEEEVDIETVDDCAPLTANIETRQNFDFLHNGLSSLPAVNLCNIADPSVDTLDDLLNFSGIEADDLESLLQQFDSAPSFQSPLLASSVIPSSLLLPSPEPTSQPPPTEPSNCEQLVPACMSSGINVEHTVDVSSPVENISDVALPVVSCVAESIEPYQLSARFFDKIPDHEYCRMSMAELLAITGQELGEQSSILDSPDSAAVAVNHKYTAKPFSTSTYQISDAGDSIVAAAATSPRPEVCRGVKTGQPRSLLRPRAFAKSSAAAMLATTSLQAAIVPAARPGATCPSTSRPSCAASASSRTGVELSSTATTSQSSCSDSGSDSEFGPRGCQSRQSRPSRCRSRSRRGSNARDCRSPSSSSSSSCSTSGTRSRSRSRSRVRSHSSRRRLEKEKQEEKRRAMTERRVVYVGNIPSNFKKADLRRCFSTFGEIEDVSVHFRDHGDNYGFVTFASPRHAVVAIEKGGNFQGRQFKLCFGGRRIFCETEYADLDGCAAAKEEWALTQSRRRDDFESLLRQSMRRIKKD